MRDSCNTTAELLCVTHWQFDEILSINSIHENSVALLHCESQKACHKTQKSLFPELDKVLEIAPPNKVLEVALAIPPEMILPKVKCIG